MPRLPTSSNVQPISPRIATDPGIQAPTGAFESPIGIAAGELVPGFEKLAEVARRMEDRDSTNEMIDNELKHNEELSNKILELKSKSDLSRDDVKAEFGEFVEQKRQERLKSFRGSNKFKSMLDGSLNQLNAKYIGEAAGTSAIIARGKGKVLYGEYLKPLMTQAANNPTIENVSSLILNARERFDRVKNVFESEEEPAILNAAQENIALSAIDSLLTRGRIEQADVLFEDGELKQYLSADKLRDTRNRIDIARSEKDKIMRKMTEAEAVMGRPLTQDERAQVLGFKPEKLSEREERSKQLRARGFSPELSDDIAAKDVKIVGPDNFGNFLSVNIANNESRPVGEKDQNAINRALGITPPLPEREAPPVVKTQKGGGRTETRRPPMEESIKKGTGPFAKIQAGISNVFGPLDASQAFFEDTTTARERIRTFNQLVKSAIVNNEKFPEGEQKRLEALLPNVNTLFKDPDTAVADFKEFKNVLEESKAAKQKEFKKKEITAKRRGELADMISTIDEVMAQMTYKPGKSDTQDFTQEDLEFTAEKHGITVDEVKRRLGAQ